MSKSIIDALNSQINAEFYSSYLYLAMAAFFASEGLNGFSHWMKIQAGEERKHGMKIFDYLSLRGAEVRLKEIAAPPAAWKSPVDVFQDAALHEKKVTRMIHDLVELATEGKDLATIEFLNWFVKEQVEEEATADEIVRKLKGLPAGSGMIHFFDKELGSRQAE
jgi:ferritin